MLRNTTRDEIVQAIRTLPVVGYMRSYRSFQNWGGEVSLLHISLSKKFVNIFILYSTQSYFYFIGHLP